MGVFDYKNHISPQEISDNPHILKCVFCSSSLKQFEIENIWGESDDGHVLKIQKTIYRDYKEISGLEDCYLDLRIESKEELVWLNCCPVCGWYRVVKDVCVCAEVWQIWDIFFGLSGTLKNLDLADVNQPISEVASYLTPKYDSRFYVNPRVFEEVVADVFKNLGYHVSITGYSNDGGIDVILEKDQNKSIGIQVKRYKNQIKAEQIRSFAGALMLSGFEKGIFVTTSDFQRGAIKASENFTNKKLPIQLINAKEFYEALKISRKSVIDVDLIRENIKNNSKHLFEYDCVTPRNSL